MAVRYLPIDGEIVSAEWFAVLSDMRRDGVWFNVNEGKRTMARQWYFWNLYQSGRGNLAAYPSTNAPHIREGRIDHAIDFSNDGAVMTWLTNHGLQPRRTVPGESWHIEISAENLRTYAKKHGAKPNPLRKLGRLQRAAAERKLYHTRQALREAKSGKQSKWRRQVRWRKFWAARVKALWRRAEGERKAILKRVLDDRNGHL